MTPMVMSVCPMPRSTIRSVSAMSARRDVRQVEGARVRRHPQRGRADVVGQAERVDVLAEQVDPRFCVERRPHPGGVTDRPYDEGRADEPALDEQGVAYAPYGAGADHAL